MIASPPLSEWGHVRTFLAVAETGSFSAAARVLSSSQPTVGRHIEALEADLGATLFTRHPLGMELTSAGRELMGPAEAMRDSVRDLVLSAAGQSRSVSGSVRITASVVMSHHVLPPIVADIRRRLPEIAIDLVGSDSADNLLFREADIAVRMFRPEQLDVTTKYLGNVALGMFASKSYIQEKGQPKHIDEITDFDLVGYDRNDGIIRGFREGGTVVTREDFLTRTDDQALNWALIRAGCGIGFGHLRVGLADPDLIQIMPELELPTLPVWLAAHSAVRKSAHVALVWEHLRTALKTVVS